MSFQYHSSRLFIFIALISPLADNKPGSILDLHIYLPDLNGNYPLYIKKRFHIRE